MGLNIVTNNTDFNPYCKYNAKAGRWFYKSGDKEVEAVNPIFIADFDNIKTGWIYITKGAAPEYVWDKSLTEQAPRPDKTYIDEHTGKTRYCYNRGFFLPLYSKNSFDGMVDFNSSSTNVCTAINELYSAFEKDYANNFGKLPVVECSGSEAVKDKFGTNYKPTFKILKWVDRPAEFKPSNVVSIPSPAVSAPLADAGVAAPLKAVASSNEF